MTQTSAQHKTYFDPHGYFFACLPDSVYRRKFQQFGKCWSDDLIPARGPSADPNLLSGALTCRLICITPVHIGIGGYRHDPAAPGKVVADIVRDPQGHPIIPGSSLKGSFRAIAEAASKSCLAPGEARHEEEFGKLPWETGYRKRTPPRNTYWKSHIQQKLVNRNNQLISKERRPTVAVHLKTPPDLNPCELTQDAPVNSKLCPCCSVFGILGYRGRIAFTNACVVRYVIPSSNLNPPKSVTIPPRNSPQPHRLADKATWIGNRDDQSNNPNDRSKVGGFDIKGGGNNLTLEVLEPLGRKFYPNWDPHWGVEGHFYANRYDWSQHQQNLPDQKPLNQTFYTAMKHEHGKGKQPPSLYKESDFKNGEPHDVIPISAILEFRLHFQSLLPWELGLILFSMGIEASWLPKIGGGKAYGLGSVLVLPHALSRIADVAVYGATPFLEKQEADEQIRACLQAFHGHSSAFHQNGARDLCVGFSPDLHTERKNGRLHVAHRKNTMPKSGGDS